MELPLISSNKHAPKPCSILSSEMMQTARIMVRTRGPQPLCCDQGTVGYRPNRPNGSKEGALTRTQGGCQGRPIVCSLRSSCKLLRRPWPTTRKSGARLLTRAASVRRSHTGTNKISPRQYMHSGQCEKSRRHRVNYWVLF